MKEHSLTKGSIFRSLLTFAVPVFLALFLQAMYGAADLIIVGQFAGTGDQSGVASGSQLFNTATMLVVGLTMGVTVFVARCMGAGEKENAARGVGTSIVLPNGGICYQMGAFAAKWGHLLFLCVQEKKKKKSHRGPLS